MCQLLKLGVTRVTQVSQLSRITNYIQIEFSKQLKHLILDHNISQRIQVCDQFVKVIVRSVEVA